MKILANDGISKSGIDQLENAGFNVETEHVNQSDLISYINENKIEVILVRSATEIRNDVIDNCPSIKIIGRGGVGMDNINVEYAKEKGLLVINTPAASSQSVAELVMAHLFSISRSVFESNRNMPENGENDFKVLKKKYAKGIELRGKNLGIIGFGRIGQNTAKYALGAGMKILAYDPFMEKASIEMDIAGQKMEVTIDTTSMEELLSNSDFISLHVPMPKDGNAIIGNNEFEKMKDGVRIVNAARGGVIDEKALINSLKNNKIKGAALDVFFNEPKINPIFKKLNNVILHPHHGSGTIETRNAMAQLSCLNLINFFKKGKPLHKVI